jgi:hypothetical protein
MKGGIDERKKAANEKWRPTAALAFCRCASIRFSRIFKVKA